MTPEKARIWFFTDLHGSNECFRKFLRLPQNENRPNVLIIGGDITGKQVVPLIQNDAGNFRGMVDGKVLNFASPSLPQIAKRLCDFGYYPFECDETTHNRFLTDAQYHEDIITRLVADRMREWVKMANETLPSSSECKVFINPGNDDPLFIDQILDSSWKIIRPEGKICELPCGLKMLSTGFSNWTPWPCPRQCKTRYDETELSAKIAGMTKQLSATEYTRAIFNFHCPPYNTKLDLANKIDPETKQKIAGLKGAVKEHVGSTAVRQAMEVWKPLLGLHGHIHEVITRRDKVGGTLCFNPGTDYFNGNLQGVYLQINSLGEIEAAVLTDERYPRGTHDKAGSVVQTFLAGIPGIGKWFEATHAKRMRDEMFEGMNEIRKDLKDIKLRQGIRETDRKS